MLLGALVDFTHWATRCTGESSTRRAARLVRLPAYPWQRRYYRAEALACREDRLGSGKHPLLDRDLRSPQQTWQAELNAAMFPFLPDHCVEGAIVFPGAGYIEAGLAAAGELAGDGPCELEGVEFHKALVADNGPAPSLRMMCEPSWAGSASIAAGDRRPSWMLHATGQFQEKKTAAPGLLPVEGTSAGVARRRSPRSTYITGCGREVWSTALGSAASASSGEAARKSSARSRSRRPRRRRNTAVTRPSWMPASRPSSPP